jgi:hypothetical protein
MITPPPSPALDDHDTSSKRLFTSLMFDVTANFREPKRK